MGRPCLQSVIWASVDREPHSNCGPQPPQPSYTRTRLPAANRCPVSRSRRPDQPLSSRELAVNVLDSLIIFTPGRPRQQTLYRDAEKVLLVQCPHQTHQLFSASPSLPMLHSAPASPFPRIHQPHPRTVQRCRTGPARIISARPPTLPPRRTIHQRFSACALLADAPQRARPPHQPQHTYSTEQRC